MREEFLAVDTVIVSDLHLSDAEPVRESRPLWKAYKRRELFFDDDFARLLRHVQAEADGPVELVLNGDIFDFDNIVQLPVDPEGEVDWLAKLRGLGSQAWMSAYKLGCIIDDHHEWFRAVGDFARAGNEVVFVVGNHDTELHWPAVQERILKGLGFGDGVEGNDRVRFCTWFYISDDTFISHGHQYDMYCTHKNPMHPFIRLGGKRSVRIPFGDLCERYLLNGMGYFNPHSHENYIMSALEYVRFFLKYMLRTQPLLLWTWFWSAMVTFAVSMRHHMAPALKNPLMVEEIVAKVAEDAKTTPSVVRRLNALNVPSACSNPLRILRELWLDRALLLLGLFYLAWQIVATINMAWPISPWWFFVPVLVALPFYFIYSFSISSAVFEDPLLNDRLAGYIQEITGCGRVVFGHTHQPVHRNVEGVEYFNSGFWSPAYQEPECRTRIGTQTFVWVKAPTETREERVGGLYEWPLGGSQPKPFVPEAT